MLSKFTGNDWALTESAEKCETEITVAEEDHWVGDGTVDKILSVARQYKKEGVRGTTNSY